MSDKKTVLYMLPADAYQAVRVAVTAIPSMANFSAIDKTAKGAAVLLERGIALSDDDARRMLPQFYGYKGNPLLHVPSQEALREIRNLVADLNHMAVSDEMRARTDTILGLLDGDEPGGEGVQQFGRITAASPELDHWEVRRDAQYVYVRSKGKPGTVQVKLEHEGWVVDIYDDRPEGEEVRATCCAEFNDLSFEDTMGVVGADGRKHHLFRTRAEEDAAVARSPLKVAEDLLNLARTKGEGRVHPMQNIVKDDQGVIRFKENKIVSYLLDYSTKHGCGLNELATMNFPREDHEQLAQLIGYSVSGAGDLSYMSPETIATADAAAHALFRAKPSDKSLTIHAVCYQNSDSGEVSWWTEQREQLAIDAYNQLVNDETLKNFDVVRWSFTVDPETAKDENNITAIADDMMANMTDGTKWPVTIDGIEAGLLEVGFEDFEIKQVRAFERPATVPGEVETTGYSDPPVNVLRFVPETRYGVTPASGSVPLRNAAAQPAVVPMTYAMSFQLDVSADDWKLLNEQREAVGDAVMRTVFAFADHMAEREMREASQPGVPRYVVDGLTLEGGIEGDGVFETWAPGSTLHPPFVVFDVDAQDNLPGHYPTPEAAAMVADSLNAIYEWAIKQRTDDDRMLDPKVTILSSNEEELVDRIRKAVCDSAKLTYCHVEDEGPVARAFEAAIVRLIVKSRRS